MSNTPSDDPALKKADQLPCNICPTKGWDCTCPKRYPAQQDRERIALMPHYIGALERAIMDNENRASVLAENNDYRAEIPAGDATALRQILSALRHTHPPQ